MRARTSGGDGWAARPGAPALRGPEELEASPMPPDHRLGLDDGDGLRPAAPQTGKQDPEQPVRGSQAWTRRGTLEDGQLMAQREVLEHQGALGPDPVEEAGEDEGDPADQDPSGRLYADEAEAVGGGHRGPRRRARS